MDIAIDVTFEPRDAYRATIHASTPLVQAPERPSSAPPAPTTRTVWWPIVVVGFVAIMCATIAFLKSPLAAHPSVAPYASAVLAKVG